MMRRITVYLAADPNNKKAITVGGDITTILKKIGNVFHCIVMKICTQEGGVIDDPEIIRDGDILCATTANEESRSSDKGRKMQSTGVSDWVQLNVGGQIFNTTRSTLTRKEPESMLARMFAADDSGIGWRSEVDSSGAYLIDRSSRYFEPVLNYLRHGVLVIDPSVSTKGVLEEARFFGMTSLIPKLEELVEREKPANDFSAITRRELMLVLMGATPEQQLRCQGMNFSNADLSNLDLRNVNFKYANLEGARLNGANLSHCDMERANLAGAVLDGAQLLGVKLLCAQLQDASMRNCNFEDPAGSRANMEGANMRKVCLEGSQMAGANLRVACLKCANLQNCDLRAAVLAGADMEDVNLNGCDLQEANLRGANLKGAQLELMVNPLHMSQTIPGSFP